jgi:hypothetical protein
MSATIPKPQLDRMTPLARTVLENEVLRNANCFKLKGRAYGRLSVISTAGPHHLVCRCSCGVYKVIDRKLLLAGFTRSCGCLRVEVARMQCHQMRSKAIAARLKIGEASRQKRATKEAAA